MVLVVLMTQSLQFPIGMHLYNSIQVELRQDIRITWISLMNGGDRD